MEQHWGPTAWGRLFTRAKDWGLHCSEELLVLQVEGQFAEIPLLTLQRFDVIKGIFWSAIRITLADGRSSLLDGIPNASAGEAEVVIKQSANQARIKNLIAKFETAIEPVTNWAKTTLSDCESQLHSKGWLTHEFKAIANQAKPTGLETLLISPEVKAHLAKQSELIQNAVSFWQRDFSAFADTLNAKHLAHELGASKSFFDSVEKSPLTEEQARAVICFDNRVMLVASAGSGKTSTMVAKAGYALKKGYFSAERILLLAFNSKAAIELEKRIQTRLAPLGLPADKVVAKTFHAFGLDVIGSATGKRPTLAHWLESGQDMDALLELVDSLKDRDATFRAQWDLFRVVFSHDLPAFGAEHEAPDSWDYERKVEGFWTLNAEVVKSRGEQLIANWLFYNGITYKYEAPYCIDTADAQHRQYHPDFYFPEIDTYLEHWAVDEFGNPPEEFKGYKEGMAWKQQLHAQHGTRLLETTMADLWSGRAFQYLSKELTALGITLDPNPDRPVKGRKPIENRRLVSTFRSFLTHAKSNRLSIEMLRVRLKERIAGLFYFRHQMFLNLFEKVWDAWEERLKSEGVIDFEDMLGMAADSVEAGQWKSPYELVMVDEFQDVSQARARLISGLLMTPGKCLFAVGDDWQSINRFAGSDLAVMTDFDKEFGKAVTLKLETTFRCPQSLCDISSQFIQKNPKQIKKRVLSARDDVPQPVRILRVENEEKISAAVAKRIQELAEEFSEEGKRIKVYVLGRYRKEREHLPLGRVDARVDVEFVTAHSSKGLEADHVIIPRMTSEMLGFPSRIEDDPVLQLAMPGGDGFPDAEERRLFYVAVTRARTTVTLITLEHKESPFIAELTKDYQLKVINLEQLKSTSKLCEKCGEGFMVQRTGPYGPFLGCARFPRCTHKEKVKTG